MKSYLLCAAGLAIGLSAVSASAATIDFESSPASFTSYSEAGATITAGGQTISSTGAPGGSTGILSEGSPRAEFRADFASVANFVSVDLGDFNADADTIFLEAYDAANMLLGSASLFIDASDATMHTLSANQSGISYVLFGTRAPSLNGSSIYADNLTFRAGAVPEPATWAMMIAGFGLAGTAARRRSCAVACA